MAKYSALLLSLLAGAASAFVSKTTSSVASHTALRAAEGVWDPMVGFSFRIALLDASSKGILPADL
jgi:hypothetical protein